MAQAHVADDFFVWGGLSTLNMINNNPLRSTEQLTLFSLLTNYDLSVGKKLLWDSQLEDDFSLYLSIHWGAKHPMIKETML